MLKIIVILIFMQILAQEFWFLTKINKHKINDITNVKVDKTPVIKDVNSSIDNLFNTNLWILTIADKNHLTEDITNEQSSDANAVISLINKKNSKQLCMGKRCMTIKGFVSNTLLLKDGEKIFSLHSGEVIFNMLKFTHSIDTKLFFEHNQSGIKYELDFFAYEQLRDRNNTKDEKQKDKK